MENIKKENFLLFSKANKDVGKGRSDEHHGHPGTNNLNYFH